MKAYFSYFNIRFIHGLQYRAAALAGIATQLAFGFMYLLLYQAFYETNPSNFPMSNSELTSYIWMQQAFLMFFMTWFLDNELFDMISKGNVAYELCRPLQLYNVWFVKNAAFRLSKGVLRSFPILLIAAFLPEPYKLVLPSSFSALILFLFSMVLAFIIVLAYCMFIYIIAFYTISPLGVKIVMMMTADFFSGGVIPLPFFPDNLYIFLSYTPFAAMQNTPFRIYNGNLSIEEASTTIILQVFWAFVLIVFGKWLLSKAVKRVTIQGG